MANAKNFRDLDTKFIQLERTISINNQSISTIRNQRRFAFQRVIDCDGTDDRCLEKMMQRQQLFFHPQHINLDTSDEYDIGKNFGVGEKCNEIHITETGIYRFTVRVNVFFQPNDKTKRLLKRLGGTLYFDLIQRQEGSVNWSRVNVRIEVNANNNSQFTRRSGLPSEELRFVGHGSVSVALNAGSIIAMKEEKLLSKLTPEMGQRKLPTKGTNIIFSGILELPLYDNKLIHEY